MAIETTPSSIWTRRRVGPGHYETARPQGGEGSDLQKFDHLRHGEIRTFADGGPIEVVDFGGHQSRGGFVSSLHTQIIDLEPGAKLTGPAAWMAVDKVSAEPDAEDAGTGSDFGTAALVAAVVALFAASAMFSLALALMSVAMTAFLILLFFVFDQYDKYRPRTIETMESAYIPAPQTRTWAGVSTLTARRPAVFGSFRISHVTPSRSRPWRSGCPQ